MKLPILGVASANLLLQNSHGICYLITTSGQPLNCVFESAISPSAPEKLGDQKAKMSPGIVTANFSSILWQNRGSHVREKSTGVTLG